MLIYSPTFILISTQNFLVAFDSPELLQMGTALVEGSLAIVRALTSTLVPSTPSRSHYCFGFGDLVRVFRGILGYSPSSLSDTLPKHLVKYEIFLIVCKV